MKVLEREGAILTTRPNWANPLQVEYTFKTGIFTAHDGTEQRWADRQNPRVSFQFTTALKQAGLLRHQADMVKDQIGPYAMRVESSWIVTDANGFVDSPAVWLGSNPDWLVPGATVIITTATKEFVVEVDTLSVNGFFATANLTEVIPAGSKVHLAYWVRPDASSSFELQTSTVWTGNLRFEAVPGQVVVQPNNYAGLVYDGREVFTSAPNWRSNLQLSFEQDRQVFDPGFGLNYMSSPRVSETVQLRATHTATTPKKAKDLIDFFLRHKGRRDSFWMPTWSNDVVPMKNLLLAPTEMVVQGSEFRETFTGSKTHQNMIVFWQDGTVQCNRIESIGGVSDTLLTFEKSWAYPIEQAARVMWLLLWRFDSDTLQVEWLTDQKAEMQMPMRTIFATPDARFVPTDAGLLARIFPSYSATMAVRNTFGALGDIFDLYEAGVTQQQIDAGKVKVASYLSFTFISLGFNEPKYGNNRLTMRFHSTIPTAGSTVGTISPEGSGAQFSSVFQTGDHFNGLGPLTVPVGARYLQVRAEVNYSAPSEMQGLVSRWGLEIDHGV